jgi:hypothetical protein
LASNDIAPPIPDHEAFFEVDSPFSGRRRKHAGLGLAATAVFVLAMRTHFDVIERQSRPQLIVHGIDNLRINQAVTDIGLIRDNDHQKSGALQFGDGGTDARQ